MIHELRLSPLTRRRLTDIVHLQMDLLSFAASTDECSEATCKQYFNEGERCYRGFQTHGHGDAIAKWLWGGQRSALSQKLEKFSKACSNMGEGNKKEQREKAEAWCWKLHFEVNMLLYPRCSYFVTERPFADKPKISEEEKRQKEKQGELLDYREYAQEFLLSFYENFLGKSGKEKSPPEFPACLFTNQDACSYGRREFLDEFGKYNPELEMCPFCDEHRLYIKDYATTRTEIDHFLPKDQYPHLACHPYNLVPICHPCNATTKGTLDPLQGKNRLSRDLFPYGRTKLRHHARLWINVSGDQQELSLKPHKNASSGRAETDAERSARLLEVDGAIQLLKDLYKIPDRWYSMRKTYIHTRDEEDKDKETQTLQIMLMSETLVRRICQFLGNSEQFLNLQERIDNPYDGLKGSNLAQIVYNDLKHLLYYLDHDDIGKEPFAFAMIWILAAFIKNEVQPDSASGQLSALGKEIVSWFHQNATTSKQRDEHVERLLKLLDE